MTAKKRRTRKSRRSTSWDPLARWYDGWVGKDGSKHHRKLAIPATLELLAPQPGEQVLDIGAGQGVLAPMVAKSGATYTGVDIGGKLLQIARKHHGDQGRFLQGDACRLSRIPELRPESFDGVVFLLSIQEMDPLEDALENAVWALKSRGRVVLLMTHPCFGSPGKAVGGGMKTANCNIAELTAT